MTVEFALWLTGLGGVVWLYLLLLAHFGRAVMKPRMGRTPIFPGTYIIPFTGFPPIQTLTGPRAFRPEDAPEGEACQ